MASRSSLSCPKVLERTHLLRRRKQFWQLGCPPSHLTFLWRHSVHAACFDPIPLLIVNLVWKKISVISWLSAHHRRCRNKSCEGIRHSSWNNFRWCKGVVDYKLKKKMHRLPSGDIFLAQSDCRVSDVVINAWIAFATRECAEWVNSNRAEWRCGNVD